MANSILKDLPKAKGEISAGHPLANLTRFKVGGAAEAFFSPRDTDDLVRFLRHAPKDMNVHALGFGSNVLVRDGGVKGIVVRLQSEHFSRIEVRPDQREIRCGAFASNLAIAKAAMESGIAGFEFLYGIPGSIGGGVPTNAGCFGGQLSDILVEIETADKRTGETKTLSAEECGLGYRESNVPESEIITSVLLRGQAGDKEKIRARMDKIKEKKDSTQPTFAKTAGSVFKNPEGRPAWKLINDAGCQDMRVGGASVSPMHANFIVNDGGATAADIEDLAEKIRSTVYKEFGVMLEYEIKIIGSRK
ncbi:MAG: UDP-N-acetylmuramate dehydrogenase [Rickettsiales bacterium]|jgi:UDP-N-acetylmuramate dehydrogenase|nr:UDP-N-acetylmuramate dehydrogenase [Rickettsiales bacterium]